MAKLRPLPLSHRLDRTRGGRYGPSIDQPTLTPADPMQVAALPEVGNPIVDAYTQQLNQFNRIQLGRYQQILGGYDELIDDHRSNLEVELEDLEREWAPYDPDTGREGTERQKIVAREIASGLTTSKRGLGNVAADEYYNRRKLDIKTRIQQEKQALEERKLGFQERRTDTPPDIQTGLELARMYGAGGGGGQRAPQQQGVSMDWLARYNPLEFARIRRQQQAAHFAAARSRSLANIGSMSPERRPIWMGNLGYTTRSQTTVNLPPGGYLQGGGYGFGASGYPIQQGQLYAMPNMGLYGRPQGPARQPRDANEYWRKKNQYLAWQRGGQQPVNAQNRGLTQRQSDAVFFG